MSRVKGSTQSRPIAKPKVKQKKLQRPREKKESIVYDKYYRVSSPLEVKVSSRRKLILNLNQLLKTDYRVVNKAKAEYTRLMRSTLLYLPQFERVALKFVMFPKTRRLCDVDNVCSVQAKFFQDALVHWGKLEDDNHSYIRHLDFHFGGIDKDNPRVDVIIKPIVEPWVIKDNNGGQ